MSSFPAYGRRFSGVDNIYQKFLFRWRGQGFNRLPTTSGRPDGSSIKLFDSHIMGNYEFNISRAEIARPVYSSGFNRVDPTFGQPRALSPQA